jgi:hypothetical protein
VNGYDRSQLHLHFVLLLDAPQGASKKKQMKATCICIWQMATFFYKLFNLYGVFVRFSTRGVQKHH